MVITRTHQLQAARLGIRCDLFDAHLRSTATDLTNPAHYRDAPALPRNVLDADHLARLKLGRYRARPGQAITAGAVIDHGQCIGGKMPVVVGRFITVIALQLRVFDLLVRQHGVGVAMGRCIKGVAPLIMSLRSRGRRRKFRVPGALMFQQITE